MQSRTLLAGALLLGTALSAPAANAQTQQMPLTYVQPLSPPAVQAVQGRLRQAGAYGGRIDGVWGPDSVIALQRFQQTHGLQVTGQLNQATVATLGLDPDALLGGNQMAAAGPPAAAPPQQSATISPRAVQAIQARLRELGFYRGNVDGVWGPDTQAAIAQFQQSRGLQPNSQLNPATLGSLGFAPDMLATR